ncbi:Down syndrome cell adhesion molecule-like protein 1 homolog isoform X2 [Limulus polyphemus]|uniref:Down syndrome cell adhesion molecule-like protein 1 homolog isoform X2 n=1 Tax=Limulus polyphemus TaxID=6850 RepID=A0ABM1SAP9_LIMPO|nr:Down syndrome cell adhesion molecule-like protein 1 homolog isoform X2 [Limulus polyphemus]
MIFLVYRPMTDGIFKIILFVICCSWHEGVYPPRVLSAIPKSGIPDNIEGPRFVDEPPGNVIFVNTTGSVITCGATGQPRPEVEWIVRDGKPVVSVPVTREVRHDGSLVFPPFPPEEFRPDVHDTVYRCRASNTFGTIGSREVKVRAVTKTAYNIRVYDKTVVVGNTAVLNCYVPPSMSEYVQVTSWITDDNIKNATVSTFSSAGKYIIYPNGDLHIHHVTPEDGKKSYGCRSKNILTEEIKISDNFAKIIIIDPKEDIAPSVTSRKQQVSVQSGEIVFLPCAAQSHPLPTYNWFKMKGSQRVRIRSWPRIQRHHGSLRIDHVQLDDEGRYLCMVNNTLGGDYSQVELNVLVHLQVRIEPHSLVVLSGGVATLTCSIVGHPIDSIVWTKNFRPLVANRRVNLQGRNVLYINSVNKEDQGMYQCFVYSRGDSQQATAQLVVGDVPPVFHQTFPEKKVHPGVSVSMFCKTSGHPSPEVIWFVDGQAVPNFGRFFNETIVRNDGMVVSYLNISNVRVQDGGVYQCKVSNPVGSVTHSNRLDIYGSPFVRPMGNVSVVEGQRLSIRCPVSGYPIHSITWEKGGIQLPVTSKQQVFPNGTLVIHQVRDSDQGRYRCIARNLEGASDHQTVNVSVITLPQIIPFDLPARVREDSTIVLTCSINKGDPPFEMEWLRNGRQLPAELGVTVQKHKKFTILALNDVKPQHGGNYTCVVSNAGGTATHSTILSVDTPPRWKIEPLNTSVVLGNMVTIDCSAEGSPRPIETWKKASGSSPKDFVPVYNSQHYIIYGNGSLTIRNAVRETGGYYLCQASNNVGGDLSKLITVIVHAPPRVHVQQPLYTVPLGNKVELTCVAKGDLPMDIQWTKGSEQDVLQPNGKYIFEEKTEKNSVKSVLFIAETDRNDTDRFNCHVTNKYGNITANFQVIVQEAPKAPLDLRIMSKTGRTITIKWNEPQNGHSLITGYHVQYQQQDSNNWEILTLPPGKNTAVIENLLPANVYNFQVAAENSIGRSNFSLIYTEETDEEVPGAPPLNVNADATGPNSIKVTWEPPRQELWNGPIKGYYIGYTMVTSSEPAMFKMVELKGDDTDLETHLTNLRRSQRYSVSVQAFNSKGAGPMSEQITVQTLADVPPTAPHITVVSKTTTSITFSWTHRRTFGSPVREYVLYYREEHKNWIENPIRSKPDDHIYTLSGLECGTKYQLYMVSTNSVGRSEPSEIISARTDGAAPLSPPREDFIHRDITSVKLNLFSWQTGGCPIKEYSIKLRRKPMSHWAVLTDHVPFSQSQHLLQGLSPGTWYDLQVTAYSSAGATEAMYEFQTFNVTFEEAVPDINMIIPTPSDIESHFPFLLDITIVVPVVTSVVIVIIIIVVGCVLCRRRNSHYSPSSDGSGSSQSKIRRGGEIMVLKEIDGSNEHGCMAGGISSDEGTQRSSSSNSHSRPISSALLGGGGLSREQELHPYALPYDTIAVPEFHVSQPSTSASHTLNRRCGDARGDNIYVSRQCRPDRPYEALKPDVLPPSTSRPFVCGRIRKESDWSSYT